MTRTGSAVDNQISSRCPLSPDGLPRWVQPSAGTRWDSCMGAKAWRLGKETERHRTVRGGAAEPRSQHATPAPSPCSSQPTRKVMRYRRFGKNIADVLHLMAPVCWTR